MSEDYGCRLYIEADWTFDELVGTIEVLTGGRRSSRTVVTRYFEVDAERWSDADSERLSDVDGFLYSRFSAYVEPSAGHELDAYVESLSQLILDLRRAGALVVASCLFEDEIARLTGWNWSESTPNHP